MAFFSTLTWVTMGLYIYNMVGGWPTPLKNHGVRKLGWWHSQLNQLNGKKKSCSKPPTTSLEWGFEHTLEFHSILLLPETFTFTLENHLTSKNWTSKNWGCDDRFPWRLPDPCTTRGCSVFKSSSLTQDCSKPIKCRPFNSQSFFSGLMSHL